jgi:hypothetical protein
MVMTLVIFNQRIRGRRIEGQKTVNLLVQVELFLYDRIFCLEEDRFPRQKVSHSLRMCEKIGLVLFHVIPAKPAPAGFKPGAGIQFFHGISN